jgi:putative membrane protein (TIGR04086 family)
MKTGKINTAPVVRILKALFLSYLVTGIFLLVIAGLLYKFRLDEGKIRIGIILTYILSCFLGGFLVGKMQKSRQFLWGLILGLLYFAILMVVSLAVNREFSGTGAGFLTTFLLCMGSGMLGGMLS